MSAITWSWKTGLAAVGLATGAVWASVGPDSILQNQVFDNLKAWRAHGRLVQVSDDQPVGDRYPIVIVLGMNNSDDPDGLTETKIREMLDFPLTDCKGIYRGLVGRELIQDATIFAYGYNSDRDDREIVNDLHRKLEEHPYFTQADGVYSVICYSKGGDITREYWTGEGDRKMETIFDSATPHLGTPTIDKQKVEAGIVKAYPMSQKALIRMLVWLDYLGVDFESAGSRWLREDCPEREKMFQSKPLTGDWYLAAGTIDVSNANAITRNLDLGLTFDKWFASKTGSGAEQDDGYYRFMGLALSKVGYLMTDGVVPKSSALCEGYAGKAHTFVLKDHNHSQMLQGNGGTELHTLMMQCLLPRILAHRNKRLRSFNIALPELPVVMMFPTNQTDLLTKAQVVGLDSQQNVAVVQDGEVKILQLPAGQYNWPQWWGNDQLIASWHHDDVTDVVVVRNQQQFVNLTNDGKSDFPAIQADGMLAAFVSDGNLMVRSVGGMAQVAVQGPINLTAPPMFLGEKIYFLNQTPNGRYELRWVGAFQKALPLAATKLIAGNIVSWVKVGSGLLAFQETASGLKPIPVVSGFAAALNADVALGVQALHGIQGLPKISEVTVGSDGTIYVVWNNALHRLDLSQLPAETVSRLEEARRRLAGEPPAEVKQIGIDQLLPLMASGIYQVDAK